MTVFYSLFVVSLCNELDGKVAPEAFEDAIRNAVSIGGDTDIWEKSKSCCKESGVVV